MRNSRSILLASLLGFGAIATAFTSQEPVPQTLDIVATATKDDGVAKGETLKTFVMLVDKAGLTSTLKEPGPFTVLAPTDAAFEKVPKEQLDKISADPELLKKVLNYHIVKGNVASTDLKDETESDTVLGEKLKISVKEAVNPETNVTEKTITFNDKKAKVLKPDIKASNGVIHKIDAVLMPPSLSKPDSK